MMLCPSYYKPKTGPDSYDCEHGIGDTVLGLGNLGTVVAITFTADATLYEIAFKSGGANSTLDSADVKAV